MEGPSLASVHREYDLGEGSGAIKTTLFRLTGTEPLIVEPARLKLFATGNAQAEKAEVMEYVVRRHCEVDGDDAADAVVLAIIAHALRYKFRCETRAQAEVLFALKSGRVPAKRRSRGSKRPNI
jgi:Holliday junction resolvasome RuvABC endonuclease subunit